MSTESDQRPADWESAEREMQRYLGGDSSLSAKYRAQSRETTPPQLDSAVLAHAQEQLQSAFATNRGHFVRRRKRRWAIPLATAATMLVGVNLVWQLRDQAVPEIASGAAVESMQRSAPMSVPAPAPDPAPQAKMQEQRAEPAAAELRVAEAERRQKTERAAARSMPAESLAADAGAAPEIAANAEALAAAAVQQQALADRVSKPEAKRAQAEFEESRSTERAPPQMQQQRADSAPMQRERKTFAASGFAAAAPAAVAPAPVVAENPAQDAARKLLRYLRMQDVARIRIEFNAADLGSDMLNAAARTATTLALEAPVETATAGDGLWRFDYRDASQEPRMIAMLQQSGTEWTLLSVEVVR